MTIQIEFDFSDPAENFVKVGEFLEDCYQDELNYVCHNTVYRFKQCYEELMEEFTLERREKKIIRERARRRIKALEKAVQKWEEE
jgi:hypothetical protein